MTSATAKEKAADAAVKAAQHVQKLLNDPNKIDGLVPRLIVWACLAIPLYFFWINRDPYTNMLQGLTGSEGNVIISGLGLILVAAVQYGEIQPFLLPVDAKNNQRKHVNRWALICYGCDIAVCYHRWPIFADNFFGIPTLSGIQWPNIGSIVAIVFGFAIWFLVKRQMGKKF